MRLFFTRVMVIGLVLILAGVGCVPEANGALPPDLKPEKFDHPTQITNKFMPMTVGARYTYEGLTVEDDGTVVPHRVVIHATGLTKIVGGVESIVSWDLDYSDGELVEAELAFFAQDNDGNVWRMGEFPIEYDAGRIIDAPAWIHGVDGALAGIMMQAAPKVNSPEYAQGWGPAVDWTDRGKVDAQDQDQCVPFDCYSGVLVVAETSASEPDAEQLKYYAPGIGNIRVGWRGSGEKTKETLELVNLEILEGDALRAMQLEALKLEQVAYQESSDVYALTDPILQTEQFVVIEAPVVESVSEVQGAENQGNLDEITVYAIDIPEKSLFELELWEDPDSPGKQMIGLKNNGDELDPPPENDPHVSISLQVRSGESYRCWIHMKVGEAVGKSTANVIFVAFSNALNEEGQPAYQIDSKSYLTAEGTINRGWEWVGCNLNGRPALVEFPSDGEVTVRLQAGMEGVGFDQLILSTLKYLEESPSEKVVEK